MIPPKDRFNPLKLFKHIENLTNKESAKKIVILNFLIEMEPDRPNLWFLKAVELESLSRYDEAVGCYQKILELEPDNDKYLIQMSHAIEKQKRFREELNEERNKLNSKSQFNYEELIKIGENLVSQEKYYRALVYYKKAIELRNNAEIHNRIGHSYYMLGKYEEALMWFDKALEIEPTFFKSLFNKGTTFLILVQHDTALTWFYKALEIEPKSYYALTNTASVLENLERYEEAIRMYDKALEINPREIVTVRGKGVAYYHLNKYEDALIWFRKALELRPNDPIINRYIRVTINKMKD